MKKFCSACGNQLELSQRFCAQCGTVNPFFVAAFTLLSDQTSVLDKLREEKERIEKDLQQKEEAQQEFLRQETIRKEKEEEERKQILLQQQKKAEEEMAAKERLLRQQLEQQKAEADRLMHEKIKQEQEERERTEAKLQQEIQRIKEETEQQKKQTTDLVNEVREGLQHIDEQNQKLKDKLELLQQQMPEVKEAPVMAVPVTEEIAIPEPVATVAAETPTTAKPQKRRAVAVVLLLLFTAIAFAGIYFLNNRSLKTVPVEVTQEETIQPVAKNSSDLAVTDSEPVITDSDGAEPETSLPEVKSKIVAEPTPAKSEKPKEIRGAVTEQQVINDLAGKRLSGCDVIIGAGEIESLAQLTLVEKLSSGLLKYKCVVTVKQKANTYYAMPYVYYNADGSFARIDGANCE